MCLEILLLSVLINLSATTDFCSLNIEYISVLFIFKKSVKELLSTYILFSFLPCEIIFWKALTVLVPLLFFKVITHAYLLKISIVHNEWCSCCYLKKDDAYGMRNTHTETIIYWTYQWDKSKKLTLKIKAITFLMTWLV